MPFTVRIYDRDQRNRLQVQLKRMRQQIGELAKAGPGPRQLKSHHSAIIRSARGNARDLATAIKEWDRDNPRKRARAQGGRG